MAQQHNRGSKASDAKRFVPQGNSRRQQQALQEAAKKNGKNGGAGKKK
jgi:hypothetical protein